MGDHRPDRHPQGQIVATLAIAVGAAAVLAVLRAEHPGKAVLDQRVDVAVGQRPDAAALAAVAAIRAAHRDELLAPERGGAVAALAGDHVDSGFVDEFHAVGTRMEKGLPENAAKVKKPYPQIGLFIGRQRAWCGAQAATGTTLTVRRWRGPLVVNSTTPSIFANSV